TSGSDIRLGGPPRRKALLPRAKAAARSMSLAWLSGLANARHLRQAAMGFAADVVFETDVSVQFVNEARRPIAAVILGIVNGDDVFELGRTGPADALHRGHLVGMRRSGRVDKGLFVESRGVDHQRIALEMTGRMTVVERECGLLEGRGHRLVHGDDADLVVELMDD